MTETTGVRSFYGGAATNNNGSAGTSPLTFNGAIPITAFNADGTAAPDGTLAPRGNWLFGNFNQNGVRDLSAVQSALAAAKALYAVEPAGTAGANAAFNVSAGVANANNATAVTYVGVDGVPHALTKGDLIAMGDATAAGRFDGSSLAALARGSAVSDAPGTAGYAAGTLAGGQAAFADAVRNGVSRKNDALAYLQAGTADATYDAAGNPTDASAFLRQTGRAVLTVTGVTTAAGVPRNATALNSVDGATGLERFTYDPAGAHAFDNHDVNLDGVVDFNDAVLVDNANGLDYTNLTRQLASTQQSPVTGTAASLDLVDLKQSDGTTVVNGSDLAAVNAGLTGVGSTNWYAFPLAKTGPGTVTWARAGGTVTVYAGAAFNLSAGRVTVASAVDPFTDSSATGLDTTQSVALTVAGTLEYAGGAKLDRLASLTVPAGGSVVLDPSTTRTVLAVGNLSLTGGTVDVGNGDLIVRGGSLTAVTAAVAAGTVRSSLATADADPPDGRRRRPEQPGRLAALLLGQPVRRHRPGRGRRPGQVHLLRRRQPGRQGRRPGLRPDRRRLPQPRHLTGWYNGDFNYDGEVDACDYTLIDNAFNLQQAPLASSGQTALTATGTDEIAAAAVPEPAAVGLVGGAVAALSARRRRRASAAGQRP